MLVAVYGNLIYDQIVTINDGMNIGNSNNAVISNNIGGIGNFYRAVLKSKLFDCRLVSCVGDDVAGRSIIANFRNDTKFNHYLMTIPNTKTSFAVNIVNKCSFQRTGFVDWGICSTYNLWYPVDANWHHLMYLDRMTINNIKEFSKYGVVSVDLCDSNNLESLFDKLQYVDYVFCSSDGINLHSKNIPYRKALIAHQPGFISVNYRDSGLEFKQTDVVGGLNVLGAGDMFSAFCVKSIVDHGKVDIELVHNSTRDLLIEQS